MWDKAYGCAKQYKCSIAYYMISFLYKSYQIVLDRDADTTGHGKDVVDSFNSVQKRYLDTCLIMSIAPEVDKIDSKRMCVDAMSNKVEVSFEK